MTGSRLLTVSAMYRDALTGGAASMFCRAN